MYRKYFLSMFQYSFDWTSYLRLVVRLLDILITRPSKSSKHSSDGSLQVCLKQNFWEKLPIEINTLAQIWYQKSWLFTKKNRKGIGGWWIIKYNVRAMKKDFFTFQPINFFIICRSDASRKIQTFCGVTKM